MTSGQQGYIYAIQQGARGPVKIGWSVGVEQRLKTLQAANPRKLNLRIVVPGTLQDERYLHEILDIYRTHGEWFKARVLDMLPTDADFARVIATRDPRPKHDPVDALSPGLIAELVAKDAA